MPNRLDESQLLDLVSAIYDAALFPERWSAVLEDIRSAFSSVTINLSGYDLLAMDGFLLNAGGDPAATKSYVEYYGKCDPYVRGASATRIGEVIRPDAIVERGEVLRTEYFNDWMQPQDLWDALIAVVARRDSFVSAVTITRSRHQKEFEADDVRGLQQLLPHIERATAIMWRFAEKEARSAQLGEMLARVRDGAVLLDQDANILYANLAAEQMLAQNDGLRSVRGRLVAMHRVDQTKLFGLICRPLSGRSRMVVQRPSGKQPFILNTHPVFENLPVNKVTRMWRQPATILFIADPELKRGQMTEILGKIYGFTPTEAAIAESLSKGLSVKAVAEARSLAVGTVRWHLKQIFHKAGVRRQGELASLIGRLPLS